VFFAKFFLNGKYLARPMQSGLTDAILFLVMTLAKRINQAGFTMLELLVSFSVTIAVFVVFLQLGNNVFYQEQAINNDYRAQKGLEEAEKILEQLFAWVNSEGKPVSITQDDDTLSVYLEEQRIFLGEKGKMEVLIGPKGSNSTKFPFFVHKIEPIKAEIVNPHLVIFTFQKTGGSPRKKAFYVIGGIG